MSNIRGMSEESEDSEVDLFRSNFSGSEIKGNVVKISGGPQGMQVGLANTKIQNQKQGKLIKFNTTI